MSLSFWVQWLHCIRVFQRWAQRDKNVFPRITSSEKWCEETLNICEGKPFMHKSRASMIFNNRRFGLFCLLYLLHYEHSHWAAHFSQIYNVRLRRFFLSPSFYEEVLGPRQFFPDAVKIRSTFHSEAIFICERWTPAAAFWQQLGRTWVSLLPVILSFAAQLCRYE